MATEPISATSASLVITGFVGTLLGPTYGQLGLVVFGALIGALAALGTAHTPSNWAIARFLFVSVGLSLVLTGSGVWLIEHFTEMPGNVALMPVACFFAVAKNRLVSLVEPVLGWLAGRISQTQEKAGPK